MTANTLTARHVLPVLAATLMMAFASACSSGSTQPSSALGSPAAQPSAVASTGCAPPSARSLTASVAGTSERLPVTVLGSGPRAVVLSNESDQDLCSWLPFARSLTEAGYQVALWNYSVGGAPEELAAVVAALRSSGVTRVVLLGASKGAKASIVAGAQITPPVQGVVSLSAESVLVPNTDVASYASRLTCAVLFVTAADDPYGSDVSGPVFLRAARNADKRLITVPGTDHGIALLRGPSAATVLPTVFDFLHRELSIG